MGKQKKLKSVKDVEDSSSAEEEERKRKTRSEASSSDDDAKANEDLSLKIVEKSMQRNVIRDPRSECVSEIVTDLKVEKKKEKRKRRKSNEVEVPQDLVLGDIKMGSTNLSGEIVLLDNLEDKEKSLSDTTADISVKAAETNPVEVSNNVVMRKLLRGPRYFDPPDNSWGACYNCGEEGHTTVNCPSEKRKKPCFVCGSFEHNAKQCTKGRDCFICQQKGHRAKDCPEKNKSSRICLRCGDLGHDMFSCRNDYSSDDLKEIQCYICGKYGHLCCVDYGDPGPRQASCYRCGLLGHTGLACTSYSNNGTIMASSSCYKCGLQGHFARECTSSVKACITNREPSTPKQIPSKKKWDHAEVKSAPTALWKKYPKKKALNGELTSASKTRHSGRRIAKDPGDSYSCKTKANFTSAVQTKHRRGWVTEGPGDSYTNKRKANSWRFMESPLAKRSNIFSPDGDYVSSSLPRRSNIFSPDGDYVSSSLPRRSNIFHPDRDYASSPRSPRKHYNLDFNDSTTSDGSRRFFQHRFPATRFRNGNYGMGINYDQW